MELADIKRLSYLNLEYKTGKEKRTIDNVHIYCFSDEQHKHRFHSENTHLNLLSDICYSLLNSLHSDRSSLSLLYQSLHIELGKQQKQFQLLHSQLDLLLKQQSLVKQVESISEKLDSLLISLIKIEEYLKRM